MSFRKMLPTGTEKMDHSMRFSLFEDTGVENNVAGHGQGTVSVPPGPWELNATLYLIGWL